MSHTDIQVERLIQRAATHFGVATKEVLSKSRRAEAVEARHAVLYCLRQLYPDWTLSRLGERVGLTHATVKHALDKIACRVAAEPRYAALVDDLLGQTQKVPAPVKRTVRSTSLHVDSRRWGVHVAIVA